MSFLTTLFSSRSSPPRQIVLLTDFGRKDHYVGAIKGVIASINPHARVIDLSHDVSPRAIRQGAYLLWSSYLFFPEYTIFVAVVDPGVGTKRRILAVNTRHGIFVAPDNGLLDFVLYDESVTESVGVKVSGSPFVLENVSPTFHGRDVFAPVAGHLSAGVALNEVGTPVELPRPMNPFVDQKGAKGGQVVHIDHFGNIITNVKIRDARALVKALSVRNIVVKEWVETYDEAPSRQPCLLVGSSGLVEIVVRNGDAARKLRVPVEAPVKVFWK